MAALAEEKKDESDSGSNEFYFKLRNVPNDHSCLFHSIGYLLNHDKYSKDIDFHYELRKIVSSKIKENTELYQNELLGINKTSEEYASWIMDQFNWGGTMDALILAKHYKINVCVIDVTSNLFYILQGNESKDCDKNIDDRIHIIYNGDHYDAAVGIYKQNSDLDDDKEIRTFSLKELEIENWKLIEENQLKLFLNRSNKEWKEKEQVLNTIKSNKKYKCQDCDKLFTSNEGMENHMTETEFEHCMFDEM